MRHDPDRRPRDAVPADQVVVDLDAVGDVLGLDDSATGNGGHVERVVRHDRVLAAVEQQAADLSDRQRRLDLLDAGGDPRAAVAAVFSWSYRHLPPPAARLFRLVGLHPGPDLDAYAAAALADTGLDQAGRDLDRLARAHLVHEAGAGRYGMHDLLRAYASGLTVAQDGHTERQAALRRLFDYYLATVAAAMNCLHPADAGLGNSAYLVDLGDRRALVVDASRDVRSVRREAGRRGLRLAFAADTHLHADFLSGAVQLAATDGASVLASAAGHREFAHTGLGDADEVDLGGLRLRALTTPGHTEEHLAFLLLDGTRPVGVFTGGSLLVGAAARTDLVAADRTEDLARAQYRSLQRLLTLPDQAQVWPTHGAGSFCSAPPGADRTSSIGRERATNPLLQAAGEDAFIAQLVGSLGSFPPYFLRLAEVNRRGPAVLGGTPSLDPLGPATVSRLLSDAAVLVDVRPVIEYADGHVPGSLSIPLRDAFATWLGWVAPHDQPLVVIRSADQDPGEITWQAAKIGYGNLVGEVAGGIQAWTAAGLPVVATRLVGPQTVVGPETLDVRSARSPPAPQTCRTGRSWSCAGTGSGR